MKISEIIQKGQQVKRKSDGKIGVVAFFSTGKLQPGRWAFIDVEGEPERAMIDSMNEWELVQQTLPLTKTNTDYLQMGETIEEYVSIDWDKLKVTNKVYDTTKKCRGTVISKNKDEVCVLPDQTRTTTTLDQAAASRRLRLVVKVRPTVPLTNTPVRQPKTEWEKANETSFEPDQTIDPEREQTFYLRQIAKMLTKIAFKDTTDTYGASIGGKTIEKWLNNGLSEWLKKQ